MIQSVFDEQDDERIQLSALEQFSYCPRQCALQRQDEIYGENIYTIKGTLAHERVDSLIAETCRGVRNVHAMPLFSRQFGLTGKADLVEFYDTTPYPVEYKIGKKRNWIHEAAQVCGQALCLEEMFQCDVPLGAVYYISSRCRREIRFTPELRNIVVAMIQEIRTLFAHDTIPNAANDARCPCCSVAESCLPEILSRKNRSVEYIAAIYANTVQVDDKT